MSDQRPTLHHNVRMLSVIEQATVPRMKAIAQIAASYVQRREDVAVVTLGDGSEIFVGTDYWLSDETRIRFELLVAEKARDRGVNSAVMVLPLVTSQQQDRLNYRPLGDATVTDGETALLWFFNCDIDKGYDLARSLLTFQDDGTADFAPLEYFTSSAQLTPQSPGFALMQGLLGTPEETP